MNFTQKPNIPHTHAQSLEDIFTICMMIMMLMTMMLLFNVSHTMLNWIQWNGTNYVLAVFHIQVLSSFIFSLDAHTVGLRSVGKSEVLSNRASLPFASSYFRHCVHHCFLRLSGCIFTPAERLLTSPQADLVLVRHRAVQSCAIKVLAAGVLLRLKCLKMFLFTTGAACLWLVCS